MNKAKTARLKRISRKCELNKTHMKDLIRWCKSYKEGRADIGMMMYAFTLKYDDVAFVIENLDEIKQMEKYK